MPAQPQDQTSDTVDKTNSIDATNQNVTANDTSGNNTSDPYSTLRAEKVTTSDIPTTMTESKRLEMSQKDTITSAVNTSINNTTAINAPMNNNLNNTAVSQINSPLNGADAISVNDTPNTTAPVGSIPAAGQSNPTDLSRSVNNLNSALNSPSPEPISKQSEISTTVVTNDNGALNIPSNNPAPLNSKSESTNPGQSANMVDVTATKDLEDELPEGIQLVDSSDETELSDQRIDDKSEMMGEKSTINEDDLNTRMDKPSTVKEDLSEDINKTDETEDIKSIEEKTDDTVLVSEDQAKSSNTTSQSVISDSAKTIADILVDMGLIDREKADQVKLAEVKSGNSQEDILKSQNIVDIKQISKAKAKLYNIEYIDLTKVPVDPEALNLLPQQVAEKFEVFPVSIDTNNNKLTVAMADPLNMTAIEFIEQRTGKTVDPRAADPSEIQSLIAAGYTTSLAKEVSAALKDVSQERNKVRTLDASRTGLIREEKVAEVVTHILGFAVKARASDIHIEPQEQATRVRYRIDGILQEKLTIPRELHDALVSRIKILSGMKIDEKRVPQDGRFNFRSEIDEVDLRVSTLPTAWGEKIVMRLLKKSGGIPELPELGLRGRALKNLQEAILRPHGIILITGPTGSGKTTTLYSIIQKLNTPKVNIMTLEDPVEYKIHGVNQVQANPSAGLTFASGMRSFLRQDPNIILVGEIRDQETADLAVQASLTGHLVFSTLHTNSAAGALPRLLDMGAEPYLLASSITAIVGQRVVRKIHQDCKTDYVPDPKIIDQMKDVLGNLWKPKPGEIKLYKGQGDKECNNSGYHGRVGVFEVLPVSEKIGRLILEQAPSGDIDKQAREEGMVTMKQDGYLKVLEGVTTIEEVLRVAQE